MRFALLAVGSRGDVEPYLALGQRLQHDGHSVRFAALAPFAADVRAAGLEFASLGELPARFSPRRFRPRRSEVTQRDSSTLFQGVPGRVLFWSLYPAMLGPALDRFIPACEGADAVVFTRLALPAPHVAEYLRVPCVAGYPVPHTPTRAFEDPLYVRRGRVTPRRVRRSYSLEWALTHQLTHGLLSRFRRDRLGLAPLRRATLRDHLAEQVRGTLYSYSEALLPRPADWPENTQVTGYWFRELDPAFQPPPEVARFLSEGAAPVCVGFGSMKPRDPERLGAKIVEALSRVGRRAIWQSGWGGLRSHGAGSRSVLPVDELPHAWLFPRSAAVLHHGGAGTTGAALRAGVPSVTIPHGFDQPFWGRQLAAAGLGPAPLNLRELTVEHLERALRTALDDVAMRSAVAQVGERVRVEDGVGRAVQWLERWCA